jgi:hypothetical protein
MPNSALAAWPGTVSPTAGVSGNWEDRIAEVTASARKTPASGGARH